MRIGAASVGGASRFGTIDGDELRLFAPDTDVYAAIRRRDEATGESVPWSADGPVPVPMPVTTIRDFITFEQHTAGSLRSVTGSEVVPEDWYAAPAFYFTNPHAAIGSGEPVPVPPGCGLLDFELEVAAVIGRAGYNLSVAEAADHIVGYTILNDWSARDLQSREMRVGLGPAKAKDTATTLGPALVTPDELADHVVDGDRLDLSMRVWVNDEQIGEDSLANMAWSFAELVAYASRGTWVRPGDVIGSGTCGDGCLAEFWGRRGERTPPPLEVGDTVRMAVAGLGEIVNRVVDGPPLHPVPPAVRRGPGSARR